MSPAEQSAEKGARWYTHRCPAHPQANLLPLPNCYSGPMVCEECHARICKRCSKPNASWLSGACDDCYRIIERELRDERRQADVEYLQGVIDRAKADAWDEAVQALAWALDNGPADAALPYVRERNPYRPAPVTSPGQADS